MLSPVPPVARRPERGGARMPGAVKTVEAQIHVKDHALLTKLIGANTDESFVAVPPPPAAGKGGEGASRARAGSVVPAAKEGGEGAS